jgi:hypothetical protein
LRDRSVELEFAEERTSFHYHNCHREINVDHGINVLYSTADMSSGIEAEILKDRSVELEFAEERTSFHYHNCHREINVDHGINVDQHSKPRNKCKYSMCICTCFVALSVDLH